MKVTILTATYNRENNLRSLAASLDAQNNKEFEWVIVDDGSIDGTEKFVKELQLKSTLYKIEYKKIVNGGKGRAINVGLALCCQSDFVLIVDDDEKLYSNAVSILRIYVKKYLDTNCVGMEFLRDDISGTPIANYKEEKDLVMSVQLRKRLNYEIDGYTGYFVKKLGDKRFPEFPGEKYIGPGVLQMMASDKYQLVWPDVSLGKTEYLEGGITQQGRKLRLKSPCGMVVYCGLLQEKEAGILIRIKYSIMAYAYSNFIKDDSLKKQLINKYDFCGIVKIIGFLLGKYWSMKYRVKKID